MKIIKLGGSLQEKGREIIRFLSDYAETKAHTFVIIPGGGHFVKRIKGLSEQEVISDDAAHWMAVLGMHQYGFYLADGSGIEIVESIEELRNVVHIGVLLPYTLLKADDSLPHTWNVTSDTIAAFVANKVGETSFIKLTDVDGLMDDKGLLVRQIHAKAMIKNARTGCVDAELPLFLMQNEMSCTIVNGNFTERIIAVIAGKETICTKIS
ncbi:amino acid kinase [ANME-1 cluster archaeon AG-394-G21]|nr:amino acid kinase [ANME-1 cluster archaeon AG-394-G21]